MGGGGLVRVCVCVCVCVCVWGVMSGERGICARVILGEGGRPPRTEQGPRRHRGNPHWMSRGRGPPPPPVWPPSTVGGVNSILQVNHVTLQRLQPSGTHSLTHSLTHHTR